MVSAAPVITHGRCTLGGFRTGEADPIARRGPNCTRAVASANPAAASSSVPLTEIIVTGCAKNIEHHKRPFFPLLRSLQALGTSLIVYEDGSTDATRARLLAFAAQQQGERDVRLILADGVPDFFRGDTKRERKIALCRHTLLHEALHHTTSSGSLAAGSAFMVALDLDCAPPSPDGVHAAVAKMTPPWVQILTATAVGRPPVAAPLVRIIGRPAAAAAADDALSVLPPPPYAWDAWDVLSAAPHGAADYYDMSALRAPVFGPHFGFDCWYDLRRVVAYGNCVEHHLTLAAGAPIVPVESAFNGLAV